MAAGTRLLRVTCTAFSAVAAISLGSGFRRADSSAAAYGRTPPRLYAHGPAQGQAAANSAATLDSLAWLDGRWRGDWGPRVAEQVWLPSSAGLMVGTFRLVEDDKPLLIELFALLQTPDGIEFRFRHFTQELAPWEKGESTVLDLQSADGTKFVFVNPVNGQPKRAILTRVDPDTYISRSEILPESGGTQIIEITYHRQKPSPADCAEPRR